MRRKVYGQSRIDKCPFCGKQAVTKNPQGVPVCMKHSKDKLLDLKCICGEWLDVRQGKFGAYFKCIRCGNVSFSKAMEANPDIGKIGKEEKAEKPKAAPKQEQKFASKQKSIKFPKANPRKTPKETVVTSDDVDIYYS